MKKRATCPAPTVWISPETGQCRCQEGRHRSHQRRVHPLKILAHKVIQHRLGQTHPADGADIEFSGRVKSLDAATRSGVVILAAKSGGRKIFGVATLNVRFR